MNQEICKTILKHREKFIPLLFTLKQINLIKKYLQQKKLTNSEKTTLYSVIKQKIEALSMLKEEYYIVGEEMIPERVEQAKTILKELAPQKAFISGSFLYKQDHNDIDIFIVAERRKSYHQENKHFIFITEKMLRNPIFISSLRYSIANFSSQNVEPILKRPPFEHLNLTYQMAINETLNKEEERTVRELVFMYYLYFKKNILNSFSLYLKTEEIIKVNYNEKIKIINEMTKELILKLYSKKYMYQYLSRFVKRLKEDYSHEPYKNFPIFINLFTEVKNECRIA